MTQRPQNIPKALIRLTLMLSSILMVVFAGLTLSGVIGLPRFTGWIFLAVAAIDLTIGFVVFKD